MMTDRWTDTRLPEPGWYLDPSSGRRRWWTGLTWGGFADDARNGVVAGAATAGSRRVPSTTNVNPWPIWAFVLLPVVQSLPLLTVDLGGYLRDAVAASMTGTSAPIPPGLLLAQLLNLVAYPISIVLAFLDTRALRRLGVDRPFHWAWSFLGIVYLIGRAVVLRRRVGRGSSPLWIFLAVCVGIGVVEGTAIVTAFADVMSEYGTVSG